MKTLAIVLVTAVAGYAIWDLFKGNPMFAARPGTTLGGISTPGYPIYPAAGTVPSNNAGTALALATAASSFAPAFGALENQISGNETDPSDAYSSGYSSSLYD